MVVLFPHELVGELPYCILGLVALCHLLWSSLYLVVVGEVGWATAWLAEWAAPCEVGWAALWQLGLAALWLVGYAALWQVLAVGQAGWATHWQVG